MKNELFTFVIPASRRVCTLEELTLLIVSYYALLESYKENRITVQQVLPFAPRIGCIVGVVRRDKRISDICEACQNWAMQRLLASETHTIDF